MRATATPCKVTPKIESWAKELAQFMPRFVEVHAIGPIGRAILNVRDFSEQHGGQILYGWQIREGATFFEAEFHAIVRYRGRSICVTENSEGVKNILFVEDKTRKPRIVVAPTYTLCHTYYHVTYPETRPACRIQVLDDAQVPPIPMEIKPLERCQSAYRYGRSALAKV